MVVAWILNHRLRLRDCGKLYHIGHKQILRVFGLCIAAWTANEPTEIDQMIDLGVDAIVTDYPGRVQRRLSDRGINW